MRILSIFISILFLWLLNVSIATAFVTKKPQQQGGGPCVADGTQCNVYCNSGDFAGWMYWSGSVWTDGVKWATTKAAEAEKIVQAMGTACQ